MTDSASAQIESCSLVSEDVCDNSSDSCLGCKHGNKCGNNCGRRCRCGNRCGNGSGVEWPRKHPQYTYYDRYEMGFKLVAEFCSRHTASQQTFCEAILMLHDSNWYTCGVVVTHCNIVIVIESQTHVCIKGKAIKDATESILAMCDGPGCKNGGMSGGITMLNPHGVYISIRPQACY